MVQQIAALGKVDRVSGSRSSLPRRVAWQGRITHIVAPCLSSSNCGQKRRCLRKVFSERVLLLMRGGQLFFLVLNSFSKSMPGRKVLSHLHVVTRRRTRSTQRLVFTGLASGGIITHAGINLEYFNCSDGGLEACCCMGEGVWPVFQCKHGHATNFLPGAA